MKWDLIKEHPQLILILRYAKKTGILKFSPQSSEIQEEDKPNHVPYRAGFYAEDINGFWNPDSLSTYIKGNYDNFLEAFNEFGFFAAFSFLSLKIPWSSWAFVLESKSTVYDSVAMDKYRALKRKDKDSYEKLKSTVTEIEVLNYLNENFYQATPSLWISKTDPSVMIYDEAYKPFKLQHGWNKDQVGEIFQEWYEFLVEEKIKTEFVLESNW